VTIESARGNLGEFYSTLAAYEQLGRDLYGDNWLQTDGLPIAQILYRIRDFPKAESILSLQVEGERWSILRDSRFPNFALWERWSGRNIMPLLSVFATSHLL
jgi:hypothetical protein